MIRSIDRLLPYYLGGKRDLRYLHRKPHKQTYHFVREHADIDLVVYAAVCLEDEVAGGLHELVGTVAQEEVA